MGLLTCFFFSSRRRHTRLTCDWSSDVCSSDLEDADVEVGDLQVHDVAVARERLVDRVLEEREVAEAEDPVAVVLERSEERRVGKECRRRRGRYLQNKE